MVLKIKTAAIILLLILVSTASIANCDERIIHPDDAYLMLDQLLIFSSKPGDDYFAKRNKWVTLVSKLNNKNEFCQNDIKIYLFIVFISDQNVLTHTNETISEKIVEKFEKQPGEFLDVLGKHQFLLIPIQNAIKWHFVLFGETSRNAKFIKKFEKLIVEKLGLETGNKFIKAVSM